MGQGRWLIKLIILAVIITSLGACASGPKGPPPPPGSLAARFQSDTALFREGYAQLSGEGRPVDYDQARAAFGLLVEKYPKSKWRGYADVFLRLMTELQTSRRQGETDKETAARKQAELEKNLGELSLLIEKGRGENTRLQQENQLLRQNNDNLKKDIDSLKRIEVEIQRRDKLFR